MGSQRNWLLGDRSAEVAGQSSKLAIVVEIKISSTWASINTAIMLSVVKYVVFGKGLRRLLQSQEELTGSSGVAW